MDAGNACIADLLDTAHHEMDCVIRNHHVYISVWFPVIGEQLMMEKELLEIHTMNLQRR